MKIFFLIMSFSSLIGNGDPTGDIIQVSEIINNFSKAADERDDAVMRNLLHDDFRAIVNQAFGSKEIELMNKAMYLDLMSKKVIGGDNRVVTILSIDLEGNNAVVKVNFTGKELVFTSFIQVVRNANSEWKVISDLPLISKA